MLPIYILGVLLNLYGSSHNYGLNASNPELINLRVRRNIHTDIQTQLTVNNVDYVRKKRQLSLFPTNQVTTPKYMYNSQKYINNGKLNYNFVTQNNGFLRNNGTITGNYYYSNRRANFTWGGVKNNSQHNFRFNTGYSNNTGFKNATRYPSRYTLMPKFNSTYYNRNYGSQNTGFQTTPRIYNNQDPSKSNFSGYFEDRFKNNTTIFGIYNSTGFFNTTVYNNTNYITNYTLKPYSPGYLPIPIYNQKPTNQTHFYDNFTTTPVIAKTDKSTGFDDSTEVTPKGAILVPVAACILGCRNNGCPTNMYRFGQYCVPNDD